MQDVERLYCDGKHGKGGGKRDTYQHISMVCCGNLCLCCLRSLCSLQPPAHLMLISAGSLCCSLDQATIHYTIIVIVYQQQVRSRFGQDLYLDFQENKFIMTFSTVKNL